MLGGTLLTKRTSVWITALALVLVGGVLSLLVVERTSLQTTPDQPTPEAITEEIIVRINAEREALGFEPFVVNEYLMLMAQWRSQDMVDGDYYSHTPPDRHPTLGDFCERLGYERLHKPSENLMYTEWSDGRSLDGFTEFTVSGWRGSYLHWRRAMNPTQSRKGMTGVGVVVGKDRIVITQLFWFGGLFTPSDAYQHNRGVL
jgi:uncharacterized protein YkwD